MHPEAYDRMREVAAEQLAKESAAASKGVLQGGKVLLREEGGTGGGLAGWLGGWLVEQPSGGMAGWVRGGWAAVLVHLSCATV